MAREVVVLGKVRGNINASDRVDIRSEGSLTGDVAAARISIEDGAYFKAASTFANPATPETEPHLPPPNPPSLKPKAKAPVHADGRLAE